MTGLHLWRLTWSHACGVYWMHVRGVIDHETGEAWRKIFEADDHGAAYIVASKAPRIGPGDAARARHPASL